MNKAEGEKEHVHAETVSHKRFRGNVFRSLIAGHGCLQQ